MLKKQREIKSDKLKEYLNEMGLYDKSKNSSKIHKDLPLNIFTFNSTNYKEEALNWKQILET